MPFGSFEALKGRLVYPAKDKITDTADKIKR